MLIAETVALMLPDGQRVKFLGIKPSYYTIAIVG